MIAAAARNNISNTHHAASHQLLSHCSKMITAAAINQSISDF